MSAPRQVRGVASETMTQRPAPNQFDPRQRRTGVWLTVGIVAGIAVLVYVATLMGWIAR